ncbi:PAS domain-containing sensor histidine kinase [Halovenus salina]|uniref:histidine kinase n=1 Tax=Halovenus salina TaxID=1510225 RepID=A0ABD5VVW3_9EURY|nr:PAS domain-containing sensor histidine kinase [Halovenus salina]
MTELSDTEQRGVPEDEETSRRLIDGLSNHAVFMLDDDGCITTWPEPARGLYGYDSTEVLGHELTMLFADASTNTSLTDVLDNATESSHEAAGTHCRADGSEFWATMTLTPLRNDVLHGYAVVSHDTTAKRREREHLERQNDRLKEFTDILAHDLRSPLAVIEGNLEVYRETNEESRLETISETTARMETLVDDLLKVANHGSAVTDPERVDTDTIVETAWEGTGGQSPEAVLKAEPIGPIRGDEARLCQLFENLFRNTVDHCDSDVTVGVGPIDSGFYVEDDGPGIPETVSDSVFDHGVTTSDDGTGYGLSIVRTIVNAHGWDVSVSEGATGGARFEITGIENLSRPGPL